MTTLRRKTFFLFWISLVLLNFPVGAQTTRPTPLTPPIADGSFIWQRLNVESGIEISDLLKQQYDQSRKSGTFPGYRLQLYFGSGVQARSHAEKVRTDFNSIYPDTKVYLIFKSPDFIVRAGDFRTKSEALKVLKSLSAGFSNAFIVTDEIAFPILAVQGEIK
ncbi:MAG: SPOR domain-containing protein [Prolixibacteraceae bacterium]